MELGSYFLFLQEQIKGIIITATGMPSQRNQSDSFRFKRAAFYQSLMSKVGLAAAKWRRCGSTSMSRAMA
jgi:hypothetical protein